MRRDGGEFEALLDAAVDAIIVIGPAGIVEAFNSAAERLFGYRADEVTGRNVSMLMPEPYRSEHDAYVGDYHATGERKIIGIGREVSALRKDGEVIPIDLAVGEIKRPGRKSRFVGIIRDIRERKRFEEQLRQREEQLRLVFDNAPLATALYGPDGAILSANQAFCAMLGYSEEELREMSARDLIHPDHREGAARRMAAAFRGELQRYALAKRYLHRSGREVIGMLHAGIVHDSEGQPLLMVAQVEDRTRELRAEDEARHHRERLAHVGRISVMGEMAAGLAHELNQPLTAITNYSQAAGRMLAADGMDRAELAAALEKIGTQALRAGEVIRRLRTMVRKRDSQRATVDVNDLVREVIALTDGDARDSGIRVRLELTPALPSVPCDAVQVQQVLVNLVRNAIDSLKDAKHKGSVTVRTLSGPTGGVEVQVADTGSGITPADAERLFEPFFTTKHEGLGLGLSISRSIVEAHGGVFGHRPNRPRGSLFWFTLPDKEDTDGG